jgi:protocatechuate 3,4-dioxygenase beta subunit
VRLAEDHDQNGRIERAESVVAEAITDAEGYYAITDVKPGTYLLIQEVPPGHFPTTEYRVTIKGNRPGLTLVINFGNRPYWRTYLPL